MEHLGEWIGVITLLGGCGVWLLKLEGRVRGQEDRHVDFVKYTEKKHEDIDDRHNEFRKDVRDTLNYIRDRIDQAVSHRHD